MDKDTATAKAILTGLFMDEAEEALAGTDRFGAFNAAVGNLVGYNVTFGEAKYEVANIHAAWLAASDVVEVVDDGGSKEQAYITATALLRTMRQKGTPIGAIIVTL